MVTQLLPEIGHFALILGACLACVQAVVPLAGASTRRPLWMSFAQPMAWGQFLFVLIAYACLTASFLLDDFSVAYIANNSNSQLPWYFKFSAVWGSHEGSVLLWSLILAGWGFAVSLGARHLPRDMLARVLGIMGLISTGFLAFVLLTSNPFARLLPDMPADGADLNPLLQDIGLIIHPPMLYMGYVGFSVAFAFAMAALMGGRLDAAWARWARPWTNIAWAFLTVGIALGSWWAYYELGWGGWWFWDPVENASLMPWLAGTALIHSLAVTEKRGAFKSWTVLLSIFAFSLSLLGTFLVRSGVLTSVHAFASDPDRGLFILVLLGITVGGSLLLFALRAPRVRSTLGFHWLSRDAFLLVNNLVLLVMMVTVLLGTLYPLVLDSLGLGKISVGPPYFNALFVPLTTLLCAFMGLGPASRWKQMPGRELTRRLALAGSAALVIGGLLPLTLDIEWSFSVALGLVIALWVVLPLLRDLWDKSASKAGRWAGLKRLTPSYWGMQLAHLGLAVTIVGVTLVSNTEVAENVRMVQGKEVSVGGYQFRMTELGEYRGPNYLSDRATVEVSRDGKAVTTLHPEKRLFLASGMPMTETALDAGFTRDLYVAMGEKLDDDSWAVRIQVKPFVRWLWLGALLMGAGGVIAVLDRRYRRRVEASSASDTRSLATQEARP